MQPNIKRIKLNQHIFLTKSQQKSEHGNLQKDMIWYSLHNIAFCVYFYFSHILFFYFLFF